MTQRTNAPMPMFFRPVLYAYIASNAGTVEANGGYTLAGTHNGKNYYQNANGFMIFYESGFWGIGLTFVINPTYYWLYDVDGTPPLSGWYTQNGEVPGPTLSVP